MNTSYTYITDLLTQIPDIPPDSIVSRTFYQDEQMKAILFGFAAGQELSEHTASQPAVLHILQGKADLTLGDDSMEAETGAWAHMPPRLPHSLYAKTPVLMLLLLFKAPK
jgi:quercetin dioxygenase-like cupin family protein